MGVPLLMVTNRVAPDDRSQDELYEFATDGQRRTFGRDDTACAIVIWSAHAGNDLGRVAGEIWRWGDELWLRNLSLSHEVLLTVPGQLSEPPLHRRRDAKARGAACSIPGPTALIIAPGGCLLEVIQDHQPSADTFSYGLPEPTGTGVPEVPEQLKPVAAALCEPLLLGGHLPAAYREIMTRLDEPSLKSVRRKVAALCRVYTSASPALTQHIHERLERQRAALGAAKPVGGGEIYPFSDLSTDDATDRGRPSLSLPDYYEVALLLVRQSRITIADLPLLPTPGSSS